MWAVQASPCTGLSHPFLCDVVSPSGAGGSVWVWSAPYFLAFAADERPDPILCWWCSKLEIYFHGNKSYSDTEIFTSACREPNGIAGSTNKELKTPQLICTVDAYHIYQYEVIFDTFGCLIVECFSFNSSSVFTCLFFAFHCRYLRNVLIKIWFGTFLFSIVYWMCFYITM